MAHDMQETNIQQALNTPHGLFVVDTVLKTKSDGQQVQLSLGWEAPNQAINPVATLVMSADFAAALAKALAAAAKTAKK
jgi:hypothetical protein